MVYAVAEYPTEAVVGAVEVAEAVAVADKETFVVVFQHGGVVVHGDGHFFFQVVEHPHVVVADEVVQLDSGIGQPGHLPEQAGKAFWHHVAVGEPEVEHVAKEDDHGGILFDALQELAELFFALKGVGARAQVGVGDEVEFIVGHIGIECVPPGS